MPRPEELVDTITALIDKAGVGQSARSEFLNQVPLALPVTKAAPSAKPPKQGSKVTMLPAPPESGLKPRGSLPSAGAGTKTPTSTGTRGGVTPAITPQTGVQTGAQTGTQTIAQSSEVRGPTTGYTDAEAREITRTLVGREMGLNELESWVAAFKREHGATPWQTGPFDETNNFVDHLLALGESEREVAMGGASPFTKAGREGNPMAQPAITPDFWANAYYNRYTGPTYIMGPSGPIWMGSQSLLPGEMPPTNAPSELGYYGAMQPRPYYEYMPAMQPEYWEPPAPSGNSGIAFAPPPAPSRWPY